jgi:FkbM family methyltransferase
MSHNFIDNTQEKLFLLRERGFIPTRIADIGANVGQFYNLFKGIFPESEILSIEGNPKCEDELKLVNPNYLISLLGSEETEKTLYVNKNYDKCTGASIYKETTEYYNDCDEIKLKTKTLDSLNQRFDFIKIDVQGAELDILKGGIKTILNCDFLLIELSIKKYNEGASLIGDVVCFLNHFNFKTYDIFSQFYFNNELTQVDILFVNEYKHKNLLDI